MSPADIHDLRKRACLVFADLGLALVHLGELEEELHGPQPAPILAREISDNLCACLEGAAAELAELITAADKLNEAMRPRGSKPGDMPADCTDPDEDGMPDYGRRCDGRNAE